MALGEFLFGYPFGLVEISMPFNIAWDRQLNVVRLLGSLGANSLLFIGGESDELHGEEKTPGTATTQLANDDAFPGKPPTLLCCETS